MSSQLRTRVAAIWVTQFCHNVPQYANLNNICASVGPCGHLMASNWLGTRRSRQTRAFSDLSIWPDRSVAFAHLGWSYSCFDRCHQSTSKLNLDYWKRVSGHDRRLSSTWSPWNSYYSQNKQTTTRLFSAGLLATLPPPKKKATFSYIPSGFTDEQLEPSIQVEMKSQEDRYYSTKARVLTRVWYLRPVSPTREPVSQGLG